MKKITMLFLIACICCGFGNAVGDEGRPVPDFQTIINGLQEKLDAVSFDKWSGRAYSFVQSPNSTPPFSQSSPDFPGKTHIQNGIVDDAHLALFQKVLEGDACTKELLGEVFVQGVQNDFYHNQALVTTREAWFNFQVHDWTKVDIKYSIINLSNQSVEIPNTTIRTGERNELTIKAGGISLDQKVKIPSLWGDDGLLNSDVTPGLGNDVRDLMAAYLTMGQQGMVDYMQAVLFETFYRGVLESVTELILSLLKKKALVDDGLSPEIPWELDFDKGLYTVNDKAYGSTGSFPDIVIEETYSPPLPIDLGDGELKIRRIRASVKGGSVRDGILQYWLNWYTVGANGFRTGYATRFAHTAALRSGGMTNLAAWQAAGGDRAQFLVNAGAGIYFTFSQQPEQPSSAIAYGGQHPMSALAEGGSGNPITYQWYAGSSPTELSPVPGAVQTSYSPTIDCYSWQGEMRRRYYRVVAQTLACGDIESESSELIIVEGGAPPTISFNVQPSSGIFLPGKAHTLEVSASVPAGTLQYLWQREDSDTGVWEDLEEETKAALTFTSLRAEDNGNYRCQVFNQIGDNPQYWAISNAANIEVAPAIVFDPQPQGADLEIRGSHTLEVGVSVAAGELEYRWYRNAGQGFQALGDWESIEGTSTFLTMDLEEVTIADSGIYRLTVRNTLEPFGTYTANSAGAAVNVSSGLVLHVDPTGDNSDGLTWATAFSQLQDAIDLVGQELDGGEVWVAGGPVDEPIFYSEERTAPWDDGSGAVTGSLVMRTNVGVYGGFEGYRGGLGAQEDNRMLRNRARNWAIIDGSRSRGGEAAWHVVVFGEENAPVFNVALDGLIISGGNAAGSGDVAHTHRGGGIYNLGSAPIISNCLIMNNIANLSGGGLANESGGGAVLTNCVFANNTARRADGTGGGGAISANEATPTLNFVTLVQNGVENFDGTPASGSESGALYYENAGEIEINNSIISGNTDALGGTGATVPAFSYSAVQPAQPGQGNIAVHAALYNEGYKDLVGMLAWFVPLGGAAVVNSGDPLVTGGDDYLGVLRPLDNTVDMGAFELSTNAPALASLETTVDLAEETSVADPFSLLDMDNSTFEAPFWKFSYEEKEFSCVDIPESSLELTVYDILGRAGSTFAKVNVTESEDPVVVCNSMSVDLDGNGEYLLTEADILLLSAGSTDNCTDVDDLIVTVSPAGFTCADAGKEVNVTVTVTDEQGNDDYCAAVVTVSDPVPPVLPSVPNSVEINLNANGVAVLTLADIMALADGATDNCAIDLVATEIEQTQFDCSHIGLNPLAMTVYDVNGNSVTGTAEVVVKDVLPPTLNGIRDRFFVSTGDDFSYDEAMLGVTADDGCSGELTDSVIVEVYDTDDNLVPLPVPADWAMEEDQKSYNFRLVYLAFDESGNSATAEVDLTLYALELPVITIEGANPVYHECSTPYNDLKVGGATAYDPQTDSDLTEFIETIIQVDANNTGVYEVIYSVHVPAFPSLAPVTLARTVEVVDTIPPFLQLDGLNPTLVAPGTEYQEAGYAAWDDCAGPLENQVVVTGDIDVNERGIYTLHYSITDPSNLETTTTRTVIVGDLVSFSTQPQTVRLYTNSKPEDLQAVYEGGFALSSVEWFVDNVGQGTEAPVPAGTPVIRTIDPKTHPLGAYSYRLDVVDSDVFVYPTEIVTVEVAEPITVSLKPADIEVGEGEFGRLRVGASGGLGQLHYQWYVSFAEEKSFAPVEDGAFGQGVYDGTSTSTLRFDPYTEAMAGSYQVEISDDFTTVVVGPVTVGNDNKLPVASGIGLALLALMTAAGGAAVLRKKSH
ncbi:MAG: DUF5011 domain-containing protein [Candidatus Hydrogenedens sp.]|jgi:hypothetical protein|nr:DUF5011 domain-containing protein [Candidatus Hydrogenedens sp.]